ncbi:MAG TPA: ATP synthase F1 subunit gamma [Candidatus Kryptobacter bacterium]|nr:MAG: ATP synthase F1 subunit gamma [Ignavibacteriae bacterium 37-53-5]HQT90591.1 ATP synthase F1 subunit gamma [Candidatus Kryptobacter bacterium]
MATLREIKRRISGVKSTEKITKAMKMVAAAKLRRAQSALLAARPYSRKLGELVNHLAGGTELDENPLVVERPVNGVAIIVVSADRGFCGSFNSNIIKATVEHIRDNYAELYRSGRVKLFTVGKKSSDFFSKRNYEIAGSYSGIFHDLKFSTAKKLAAEVVKGYLDGSFDRVDVVYSEFKSVMHQNLVVDRFLPIPKESLKTNGPAPKDGHSPMHVELQYIYEPSIASILESLMPKHLEFQIWRMLLESNTAGEGARMAAMDNASENATELISTLSLQYNKARQTAITKELLEVVSGAEALTAAG